MQCSALSSQGVFNNGVLCKINMAAPHLENKLTKYIKAHQKQEKIEQLKEESPFCNAVQLQWEKTFNSTESKTIKNQRKAGIFYF